MAAKTKKAPARRAKKPSKTHGAWFWHELMTPDARKAKSFYGKLFGWTTQSMKMGPGMTYTLWRHGKTMHGGMMNTKDAGGAPPQWMIYVQVDDVDASAKRVPKLGGKIVAPPFDVANVGRICIIVDSVGATIALMQPSR
jgi:predicted enzyme related to lactoylglutathione lyase